jgi:hypothetical protein
VESRIIFRDPSLWFVDVNAEIIENGCNFTSPRKDILFLVELCLDKGKDYGV